MRKRIVIILILIAIAIINFVGWDVSASADSELIAPPNNTVYYSRILDFSDFLDKKNEKPYFSPYSTSRLTLTLSGSVGVEYHFSSMTISTITGWDTVTAGFKKYFEDKLYVRLLFSPHNTLDYELISSDVSVGRVSWYYNSLTDARLHVWFQYNIVLSLQVYNPLFEDRKYSYDYYAAIIEIGPSSFANLTIRDNNGTLVLGDIKTDRLSMLGSPMTYTFKYPMPVKFNSIGFSTYLDYSIYTSDHDLNFSGGTLETKFMGYDLPEQSRDSSSTGGCWFIEFDYEVETDTIEIYSDCSGYPVYYTDEVFNDPNSEMCFSLITNNLWLPALDNQAIAITKPSTNKFVDFYNSFASTQSCKIYDIPCHLGNALTWILHKNPIFKGIYNICLPLINILITFIDLVLEFKELGIVSMVIMFILVLGVLFKWISN